MNDELSKVSPEPSAAPTVVPESNGLSDLEQLWPWQQLRWLKKTEVSRCPGNAAFPRLKLRGNPNQLRAVRAAEMEAWGNR